MTNPVTGFAALNGTRLFYEIAGEGQPLVLVHGFGLDLRLWDEQFRDYARRFRVLRYDLRGFGRSDLPGAEPYRHHDDLRALLDHFEIDQAALVGLSMGGWVTVNFALANPDRVSALVLVDAILDGRSMSPEWEAEIAPIWRQARELGAEATKQRWQRIRLFEAARANPQTALRLAQIINEWSGWQFVNPNPENTPRPLNQSLTDVRAPTLVVVGEHDLPEFQAFADELQAIPLARKVTVPGAGHLPPIETPALFDALVLGFLETLEP